jgi:hypothetical protein
MPSTDQGLLERLCTEIEAAWEDRREYRILHHLAEEYPDLSDELYDFFAVLTSDNDPDLPPALAQRAVARTREWLESGAYDRIVQEARAERRLTPTPATSEPTTSPVSGDGSQESRGAPPPRSFIGFLQQRTQQPPMAIAARIPHASVELLTWLGRHPDLMNSAVRRSLARAIEVSWTIPQQETLLELNSPTELQRAASRRGAYGAPPDSFRELLRRTGLSPADQRYWLRVAEEATPES